MLFECCKFVITNGQEYSQVNNHLCNTFKEVLNYTDIEYPLYMIIDNDHKVTRCDKTKFDKNKFKSVSLSTFLNMKYIVSDHFKTRFKERYENCSDTRINKLVHDIFNRGKWLKRKDSIQLVKYNESSNYVVHSRFEKSDKVYYLLVLSDKNILKTIYEFDIKDMKYFKEM